MREKYTFLKRFWKQNGSGLLNGACMVAQTIKKLPVMQETRVQSLGWEDPLEKGMATQSSILAWRVPWTEEPGRLPSKGMQSWTQTSQGNTGSQRKNRVMLQILRKN